MKQTSIFAFCCLFIFYSNFTMDPQKNWHAKAQEAHQCLYTPKSNEDLTRAASLFGDIATQCPEKTLMRSSLFALGQIYYYGNQTTRSNPTLAREYFFRMLNIPNATTEAPDALKCKAHCYLAQIAIEKEKPEFLTSMQQMSFAQSEIEKFQGTTHHATLDTHRKYTNGLILLKAGQSSGETLLEEVSKSALAEPGIRSKAKQILEPPKK